MRYIWILALLVMSMGAYAQRDVKPTEEVRISGDVKEAKTYTIADIKKLKQADLGDVAIKNHKGEDKYVIHNVKGIPVKTLLEPVSYSIDKPKDMAEIVLVFTASDGYRNVYSWSEIYNTPIGDKLYIITSKDGKDIADMGERIQVLCLADLNNGMRHMRGLASIEVRRISAR